MIGDSLIREDLLKEIDSTNPDFKKIKYIVIQSYNEENNENIDINLKISTDDEDKIIIWLNRCFSNPNPTVAKLFLKNSKEKIPFFSQCLSNKIEFLSQYHCPICYTENQFPIMIIPIRISSISKQAVASKPKLRVAFEKAINSRFEGKELNYKRGEKLCVQIVFVMGKDKRDKDLDNMAKALMDALEGNLFERDIDIDHLNLLKIKWDGSEDYIKVNIRRTDINEHKDVLFKKMAHGWAGSEFLDLNDFIE